MSKIMAGKIGNKPRAGILEFKLVHPRSAKASTYFIRYISIFHLIAANSSLPSPFRLLTLFYQINQLAG